MSLTKSAQKIWNQDFPLQRHFRIFDFYMLGFFFISTFFACKPIQKLPDPLKAGWNNETVCELLEENKEVRVLKCTFPPGTGHEKHYHDPHFGYTLAGSTFRITDKNGTRELDVKTGGHFYSEGLEWHEVLNIGDSTAVFLIIENR